MEMIDTMECTFFQLEYWGKFFDLELVYYEGRVPTGTTGHTKFLKEKGKIRTEYDPRTRLILSLTK